MYKSRDALEKLFKADKTFLGNKSMRVYSGKTLEGKVLVALAALILNDCTDIKRIVYGLTAAGNPFFSMLIRIG